MNGKYKNYKLVQQASGFDLIETVKAQKIGTGTIKEPNGEFHDKEINHGYNMAKEYCLEKIIHLEMLKDESTVELSEFYKRWKQLSEEIKQSLKF